VSGAAHNEEVEATVETPLHRAPAECKVLATIVFVLAVALVPYTAGDDALRSALRSFDTVVVYKGGRHLPAVLRAVDEAGGTPVYGEELGRPRETLVAPDGAAPYFSTVIVPADRGRRGSRL
jgi:precorrin-2 methylase